MSNMKRSHFFISSSRTYWLYNSRFCTLRLNSQARWRPWFMAIEARIQLPWKRRKNPTTLTKKKLKNKQQTNKSENRRRCSVFCITNQILWYGLHKIQPYRKLVSQNFCLVLKIASGKIMILSCRYKTRLCYSL